MAKEVKDFVVAIEFGSSKVTGIAGKKNSDGSITVLAYAREESSSFIKRGMVYNIDKTAQCLINIRGKLEKSLKAVIGKAYIGISGQSLHSVHNNIELPLAANTVIAKDTVDDLKRANREHAYEGSELLQVIPQEYKVGQNYQLDPVGVVSDSIEGHYANIIARTAIRSNIEKSLALASIQVADYIIAPLALAECVLTDAEKRSGCALVDLGAQTTTVSVYKNNILRHLTVIPLGANNITKDISAQQIEEEDAEELKLKYGCAYTEESDSENEEIKTYKVTDERDIEVKLLNDIVESRVEEIIANVSEQIRQSGYANDLMSGIILTGGGSNLKNMELAFKKRTNFEKIKTAKFVNQTIDAKNPDIKSKDGSLNTILSLMITGKENCFDRVLETESLFGPNGESMQDRQQELLRQKAEEEAKEKERQEKERQEIEAEIERKKKEEEERKRQENSWINKLKKNVSKFGATIFSEED